MQMSLLQRITRKISIGHMVKTNPIQSQFLNNCGYFPYAGGRASLEYGKICVNSSNVPER